eukprot:TRINITY_DN1543_c0_g1_i2.p1 TRINITY_DN1543_c0_g1~~TRINITY_DN1543_c0_g1_i2.p1  ORF type:complete len:284 (-),score=35.40 TRINITY_DN1543_c0_g1_i2:299-1150(-)
MSGKKQKTPPTNAEKNHSNKKRKLAVREEVFKLSEPHPNYNEKITKILKELGKTEKNLGNIHKYHAYQTAVSSISAYHKPLESGVEAEKALDGVGKKISCKIQEILDTGKLKKLEKYQTDERVVAVNLFCKIIGVGPKIAIKWVDEGARTLEEIATKKLNHQQQLGVKYFNDIDLRIPRDEMDQHLEIVKKSIKEIDNKIVAKCCGSYRRGLPESGDIDILLTHPSFDEESKQTKQTFNIIDKIVTKLEKQNYILDHISNGPFQYMGFCRLVGLLFFLTRFKY